MPALAQPHAPAPDVELDGMTDADLAALVRSGDMAAADVLVRRLEPMIRSAVGRLRAPPRVDHNDLMQMGRLAVVRAARGWKPDRDSRFRTYCWEVIRRAVRDELLDQLAAPVPVDPLPDERDRLPHGGRVRLDTLAAPAPAPPPDVSRLLAALDPVTRDVVRAYFGFDGWPVLTGQNRKKGRPGGSDALAARFGLTRLQLIAMIDQAVDTLRGVPVALPD